MEKVKNFTEKEFNELPEDMMYEEMGGNMVKCAWIEDNSIMKLIIQ